MILLGVFALLFLPSDAGSSHPFRVPISNSLKLKCDALPYRTAHVGTRCYFAVINEVNYSEAAGQCSSLFPGSQVAFDAPKAIFTAMMLDKSKFHVGKDTSGAKQSICVYDSDYKCADGKQSSVIPGKCLYHHDKKFTGFDNVGAFCRARGMEVPSIGNDQDNQMVRAVLLNDPVWVQKSYITIDNKAIWRQEQGFARYNTCNLTAKYQNISHFYGGWQKWPCSWNFAAAIETTGYWGNTGKSDTMDVVCMKDAKNAFTEGMTCPATHEIDEETGTCRLTCESFVSIPGQIPCYCEKRTKGRFSTNGLCRRIGTSKCGAGLLDVGGLCVGSSAIIPTTRANCLSQLQYKTSICVANELLLQNATAPTATGAFTASLDCGSQLYQNGCATNVYNVSIRGGLVSDQVLYFNAADEPVFLGSCDTKARDRQETFCSSTPVWNYPRCTHHEGGSGWTRAWDESGCVKNDWRANTTECAPHSVLVGGSGGKQCFGHEKGAWMSWGTPTWYIWDGSKKVPGPTERDYLVLPRVVIVPGIWMPERVKQTTGTLTCASFVSIPGQIPCYCEKRSKGRFSTNGLCRRIGTSKCDAGLIDVGGLCVGSSAIIPTTRANCLSQLQYKTSTCVANELLLQNATAPTATGAFTALLDCGSQLYQNGCATNVYNVSIRGGLVSDQVLYFNAADEPVFLGSCDTNARKRQETYCSSPPVWDFFPRCTHHKGGSGWTRAYDVSGCVANDWRANTTECAPHSVLVGGSGGKQCFGHEKGAWMSYGTPTWYVWDGSKKVPGPTERDYLVLPRVVIVPGNWMPERVK